MSKKKKTRYLRVNRSGVVGSHKSRKKAKSKLQPGERIVKHTHDNA